MSGPTPAPARRLPTAVATVVVVIAVVVGVGLGVAALTGRPGTEPPDGALATATPSATAAPPTAPASAPPTAEPGTPGAPAPSGTDAGPASASIAFLGDSLTVGLGAPAERGYAWQTAERLGWPIALVDGVPGSGFLATGGGRAMPERVPDVVAADPDVVVVAGGTNDVFGRYPPDDVERAATALLEDLHAGLPDARVVVLGPLPTSFAAVDSPDPTGDAVRSAAEATGAEYLDAGAIVAAAVTDQARWDSYLSPDGLHPNERGYAVLAEALAAALDALVG